MENILVVDDELNNLNLIKCFLEAEGMIIHCATSGEDALRKMKDVPFHLMITDFNMPGMDGMELARKALEIAPDMPIIMLTGEISPEIPQLAEKVGIKTVLAKPIHPIELLKAVRQVIGNRREGPSSIETAIERETGRIKTECL
jgi:CheY-like chemotaxis protein